MIEMKKDGSSVIIKIGTDLVSSTTLDLKPKLRDIVAELDDLTELVIDLDGVKMVDSSGISVLLYTYRILEQKEGKLKVINTSEDVYELFSTINLDHHFEITKGKDP